MQCKDVEEVLEQEGLAPLPEAARTHVAGCSRCQGLLDDLETIVSTAHELPAEVEPPARVWVSLRNQLEREGVIRETVTATETQPSSWWQGMREFLRGHAFAAATVGALLAVAAVVQLRPSIDYRAALAPDPASIDATVKLLNQQEVDLRNMHLTGTSPVDASLQQNLQQIDDFIADCERHLKESPQDELAREYLYSAYQQKAELLAAMMDRGRSVN